MEPAQQLWPTDTQASFMHEKKNLSKSLLASVTNHYTGVVPLTWLISLKEQRLPSSEKICIGMKGPRGSHSPENHQAASRAEQGHPNLTAESENKTSCLDANDGSE